MKIGILLPQSKIYPLIAKNFLDGFRFALPKNHEVEIIYSDIQNGGDADLIRAQFQKLLLQDQVDLNIAMLSLPVLFSVADQVLSYKKPLIVNNLGGKIPFSDPNLNFLHFNSLELWKSCFMAGQWAAQNMGGKAAIASYFYESGYSLLHAFAEGFRQADGEIVLNHIAQLNPDPNDYEILQQEAKANEADFIFACYSERDAVNYFNKYSELGSELPVLAVSSMLNRYITDQLKQVPQSIVSCGSWFEQDELPMSKQYEEHTGEPLDSFSLLGYEMGSLVTNLLNTPDLPISNGTKLNQQLESMEFAPERFTVCDRTKYRIVTTADHDEELVLKEKVTLTESDLLQELELSCRNKVQPGWRHPYLVS